MILLYHKVAQETPSIWWVSADAFDRQMADLQAYDVVSLADYDPSNPRHVVITFDGVYENVWQFAFPILKKWGYPFELFVIGQHVGGDNAFDTVEPPARFASVEQLKAMAEHGGHIQWHSMSHRQMDALTAEDVEAELTVPAVLSEAFPAPHFQWFAYPHGDHSEAVVGAVRSRFDGALSCVAGNDEDRYQLNRVTVYEDTKLGKSSVAVIVACYNYRAYVAEAIESVLTQTRAPDEIIVIDDASTDGSDEVIARYADRVRSVRNERNLGIVDNFNKAVSLTQCDYVVFLGADNRMRVDCVERYKAALDANAEAGVAYSDMLIYGARAKILADAVGAKQIGDSVLERYPVYLWAFPEPEGDALENFATRNFVHGSSMFRRKAFDQVGGYLKSSGPEDHNLFFRMYKAGWGLVHVGHALINYRQHSPTQANSLLGLQIENEHLRGVVASVRTELERTVGEVHAALGQVAAKDAALAQMQSELSAAQEWTRETAERLAQTAEQLTQTASARDSGLERIAALENALWQRTNERDAALVQIAAMRASTSWRLMAPVRLAGHLAHGNVQIARNILHDRLGWAARHLPPGVVTRLKNFRDRMLSLTGILANSSANFPAIVDIVNARCEETRNPITVDPLCPALPAEWPRVDMGVVTYNSRQWISGFVDSLLELDYPKDRVTIRFVDNSSTDSTVADLHAAAPRLREAGYAVEIIKRPNLGFGAGHNAAIRAGNAPYCLVTNIDLTFDRESLRRIVATAVRDRAEAAAWELRQKPYEHPKFYDPVTGTTNWNAHACVLLRRSALDSVGGYDESLFMYGEDVELSYRLRRGGFILRYCPAAFVWHYSYEHANHVKPQQYTGSTFANLYLRLKYGNRIDILAILPLAMRLLAAPQPYPGSRRQVMKKLLKLAVVAPFVLHARHRSEAHFPFRTWDYDFVRSGAFVEQKAIPENPPLVSLITRTYRGREAYLRQALLSGAHQTWPNLEHIVVEDGGDTMRGLVEELAAATGRTIRFIANGKFGRSNTGNVGLAAAQGRWCMFLDDDDLLFADHIEVLANELLAAPDAVASYSPAWEVVTDTAGIEQGYYIERTHNLLETLCQDFDYGVLCHHNFIAIQSALFERQLFVERGGFKEDMDALEDWVLWANYARGNRFVYVPKVTSMFRTPADLDKRLQRAKVLDAAYPLAVSRIRCVEP